jgi:hypothetical protein
MNKGRIIVFLLLVILLIFILEQRGLKFILLPPRLAAYVAQVFSQQGNSIFLTVVFIMSFLIYFNIAHVNFDSGKYVLTRKVVMENMVNNDSHKEDTSTNTEDQRDEFKQDLVNGFCKTNSTNPSGLDEKCGKLSEENCNATSCCIYVNNTKCMAGNANGPTFSESKDGKPFKLDNYYFQDKCFGNCEKKSK